MPHYSPPTTHRDTVGIYTHTDNLTLIHTRMHTHAETPIKIERRHVQVCVYLLPHWLLRQRSLCALNEMQEPENSKSHQVWGPQIEIKQSFNIKLDTCWQHIVRFLKSACGTAKREIRKHIHSDCLHTHVETPQDQTRVCPGMRMCCLLFIYAIPSYKQVHAFASIKNSFVPLNGKRIISH